MRSSKTKMTVGLVIASGVLLAACASPDGAENAFASGESSAASSSEPSDSAGEGVDGEANEASSSVQPPDTSTSADQTVGGAATTVDWLGTEFRLPPPWELLSSDGGFVVLENRLVAGPEVTVYVGLTAEDGLPSAELVASASLRSESGDLEPADPVLELPQVFATGESGVQRGEPGKLVVNIVSETGIRVDISAEAEVETVGLVAVAVPQSAVQAVRALLATITPPSVTPIRNPEPPKIESPFFSGIGLSIPEPACIVFNDPESPRDAAGNYDGFFERGCNTSNNEVQDAYFAVSMDWLLEGLIQCPNRREAVRRGPPPGYVLWYPDGRTEVNCTWRPTTSD